LATARKKPNNPVHLNIPLAIAVSFFLIADIDGPGETVQVAPKPCRLVGLVEAEIREPIQAG
jgi:hypothetical protein